MKNYSKADKHKLVKDNKAKENVVEDKQSHEAGLENRSKKDMSQSIKKTYEK